MFITGLACSQHNIIFSFQMSIIISTLLCSDQYILLLFCVGRLSEPLCSDVVKCRVQHSAVKLSVYNNIVHYCRVQFTVQCCAAQCSEQFCAVQCLEQCCTELTRVLLSGVLRVTGRQQDSRATGLQNSRAPGPGL